MVVEVSPDHHFHAALPAAGMSTADVRVTRGNGRYFPYHFIFVGGKIFIPEISGVWVGGSVFNPGILIALVSQILNGMV